MSGKMIRSEGGCIPSHPVSHSCSSGAGATEVLSGWKREITPLRRFRYAAGFGEIVSMCYSGVIQVLLKSLSFQAVTQNLLLGIAVLFKNLATLIRKVIKYL